MVGSETSQVLKEISSLSWILPCNSTVNLTCLWFISSLRVDLDVVPVCRRVFYLSVTLHKSPFSQTFVDVKIEVFCGELLHHSVSGKNKTSTVIGYA